MEQVTDKTKFVAFYPSDWRAGTVMLSPLEEWVYFQLCMVIWETGEAIHEDEFARLMMRHPGDWKADLASLVKLKKVHRSQGRLLTILRAEREVARARKKRRIAVENLGHGPRERGEKGERTPRESRENAERKPRETQKKRPNSDQLANYREGEPEPEPDIEPDSSIVNSREAPPQRDGMPAISPEIWQRFLDFRMARGSPIIGNTAGMVMTDLQRIWESHRQHPDDVIEQSLRRQWSSLRPLRPDERKSGWRLDD